MTFFDGFTFRNVANQRQKAYAPLNSHHGSGPLPHPQTHPISFENAFPPHGRNRIQGPFGYFPLIPWNRIEKVFYPYGQQFRPRVSEPLGRIRIAVQNLPGFGIGNIDRFGGVFDDGSEIGLGCGDLLQGLFESEVASFNRLVRMYDLRSACSKRFSSSLIRSRRRLISFMTGNRSRIR